MILSYSFTTSNNPSKKMVGVVVCTWPMLRNRSIDFELFRSLKNELLSGSTYLWY